MSVELSEKREASWLSQAVFALDRRLRRRSGSYEYSQDPICLFRIEPRLTDETCVLSDGTRVQPGEPTLRLHFWNEHMPRMGPEGPTVGWARQAARAVDSSLRELALYLARHSEFADVRVLFGDMSLATDRQSEVFRRLIGRYGFEIVDLPRPAQSLRRRIGLSILILLLVLATNPIALRRTPLRHRRTRVYISRARLDARFGSAWFACGRLHAAPAAPLPRRQLP